MIEVNLLPGGKKRSSRGRGFSLSGFSLPKLGGGGGGFPADPYILGAVASGIVAFAVVGWLYFGVSGDREEVQVALQEATQDSIRYADLIQRTNQLTARRDSIGQRVAIIQEIDAGRYVWPHILDELARALPDYTWIREVNQLQGDPLQIRLTGNAGSNFAITNYMRNLEASPFLRGVTLERTEQELNTSPGGAQGEIVYLFELTVGFEAPPLDELQTVPLFDNELAVQAAAPDTVGN